MLIVGLLLAALAALLHGYIFFLQSVAWTSPEARRTFGVSVAQAEQTRQLAFNQGFYNLFLAILVALGSVLVGTGRPTVGLTLVLAGVGSMLAAALVLGVSSRSHRRAAVSQGALPLLAIGALAASLV